MNNTKHEYYEMLISQDLDGELNDIEERQALEKHLLECKKCQKIKSEFKSLSAILNGESINANTKKIFVLHQRHFPALKIAASIIVMITLSIGSFTYLNKNTRNDVPYSKMGNEKTELVATTLSSYIETEEYYEDDYVALDAYFAYFFDE